MGIATPTNIFDMISPLAANIAARADDADKRGALPAADVQDLREAGFFALTVPREFGGQGLSLRDTVALHLEIAKASASTAILAAMPLHIFGHGRECRLWDDATFERLARIALDEKAVMNFVASEPKMGSPSRGRVFQTLATPHEDGWLINGHKNWVTGGRHLTHLLVRATLDDEPGVIMITGDNEGLHWEETWGDALSLRASDSHDLHLRDVIVPHDAVIEKGTSKDPLPNAWFALLTGSVYLGAGLAARDGAIRYALERVPTALGKPISTLPKIQRQIGEMDVQLKAAVALMLDAAATWDEHLSAGVFPNIAAAKHFAVETAITVTDIALKIGGGSAVTKALPLERFFRDARAGSAQPPSGDTALEIVGRGAIQSIDTGDDSDKAKEI